MHAINLKTFFGGGDIYSFEKSAKFKVGTFDFNATVLAIQPLCEGPVDVSQSEDVQVPYHSLVHLLNVFKTNAIVVLLQLGENLNYQGARKCGRRF